MPVCPVDVLCIRVSDTAASRAEVRKCIRIPDSGSFDKRDDDILLSDQKRSRDLINIV